MNVVLKKSRKTIGTWKQPISVGQGVLLPREFGAAAYRYGQVILWEPAPPPNHRGQEIKIPYWLERNSAGEIDFVIEEQHEALFRQHPLFAAMP